MLSTEGKFGDFAPHTSLKSYFWKKFETNVRPTQPFIKECGNRFTFWSETLHS